MSWLSSAGKQIGRVVKDSVKATERSFTDPLGQLGSQFNEGAKAITGSKIPSANEIGRKLSINTLMGKDKKQASAKAGEVAKADAVQAQKDTAKDRIMAGGGSSEFMNQSDGYIAEYGANRAAAGGQLADMTTKAYRPLSDQLNQIGTGQNVDPVFRDYQKGLAAQLQAQANGQGPSIAQMQLQQATDRTLNQSLGAIRSATGANAGLSARTAALAGAQQLGSAGNASGQLRLQEQQQAQQMLAGVAGQGRSGDDAALGTRLRALDQQRGVIGDQISGATQVLQGELGLDAAAIEDKRRQSQKAKDANKSLENNAYGALINGAVTWMSGGSKPA